MRMLYLAGLVVLDLAVLALGAGMIATMDLDKAGTLGVLATVPVVLLVLSDFPVAHVALSTPEGNEEVRRTDRRITVLLASVLTAAGALPLLLVTAAVDGPLALAAGCTALAVLALVYAFLVGDRVARRRAARLRPAGRRTLVPRRSAGRAGMRVSATLVRTGSAASRPAIGTTPGQQGRRR